MMEEVEPSLEYVRMVRMLVIHILLFYTHAQHVYMYTHSQNVSCKCSALREAGLPASSHMLAKPSMSQKLLHDVIGSSSGKRPAECEREGLGVCFGSSGFSVG